MAFITKLQTSEELIKYCHKNGVLNYYAVFLKIKTLHINSIVYNYTVKTLAKKLKISTGILQRSITYLKNTGFLEIQKKKLGGKNLRLLSLKNHIEPSILKLSVTRKCTIAVNSSLTILEIKDRLILKLVQEQLLYIFE